GLGEFFYRNEIDFRGLVRFPCGAASVPAVPEGATHEAPRRYLVPMGGGKDSIVTMELLKGEGHLPTLFRMGRHPLIDEVVRRSGLPLLTVERALAPELFRL